MLGVMLATPFAFATDDTRPSVTLDSTDVRSTSADAQFAADVLSEYFEDHDSSNYWYYALSGNSVTFYFFGPPSTEVREVVFREIADRYPDVEIIVRDDGPFSSYESYQSGAYELFESLQQREGFTTISPSVDNQGIVIGVDPAVEVSEAVLAEVVEEARSIFGNDIGVKFEPMWPITRGFGPDRFTG